MSDLKPSLQMPVYGNWQQKQGGGHTTFVQWWRVSRCKQSCRYNWIPSPWQGAWGDVGETLVGHGIPFDSTKPHFQVQKGLWPHCSMGTSLPSPLPDSRGGVPPTCATSRQKHGPLHGSMMLYPMHPYEMKGMSAPWQMVHPAWMPMGWLHQLQVCKLLQHEGRVVCPEGLNCELEALQFTLLELPLWDMATPREPFQEPQLLEVGLQPCAAWEHDNHHSGSHHYTNANPLSGWYHWASLWHCHGHQLTSPGGLRMVAAGFLHSLSPCLPA